MLLKVTIILIDLNEKLKKSYIHPLELERTFNTNKKSCPYNWRDWFFNATAAKCQKYCSTKNAKLEISGSYIRQGILSLSPKKKTYNIL